MAFAMHTFDQEWTNPKREMISSMEAAIGMKSLIRNGQIRDGFAEKFIERFPQVCFPKAPVRVLSYGCAGGISNVKMSGSGRMRTCDAYLDHTKICHT